MRIITWNVNSIGIRIDRLIALLRRHQPDVVCLQELKCEDIKFPFEAIKAAGYDAATLGQKSYNGVALLYRIATVGAAPATIVRTFGDGVDDPQARFIGAKVAGINVYSLYFPNGQEVGADKYFYKLNWYARLRRYLDREHSASSSIVLAGDYNVAPADADVHNPAEWKDKILCSVQEREALGHLMAFGFDDSYRYLHPDETQFTWWDYRMLGFAKNAGLRIDLLLTSTPLRSRLHACHVDRDERKGEKPSDHAPVILDLLDA